MNNKAILNKVRELLGMEVKLEQRKLEDGVTIIEADEFAPENEVVIITEDEQRIPLPIGEYKMEDGMILVVTEEGLIAEIKEEAAEEEEEVIEEEAKKDYEEKEEEMADESKPVKKVVESIVKETFFNEIETLKKENEELKAKLENLSKVETEETEKVEEVVEDEKTELSTEDLDPAVKPISFNPENKEVREKMLYAQNRTETTLDRVFKKLNK
jgi:flagellar biosynthesis GTPase FlhF